MADIAEDRRSTRTTDFSIALLVILLGAIVAYTVCAVADFGDGSDGDARVDPDVLVLDDDLSITVAGEILFDHDRSVTYDVQVYWVDAAGTTELQLVGVDITYDPGQEPGAYDVAWVAPLQLLQLAESEPPCTHLGSWRVIGVAEPIDSPGIASYHWDSVETFQLVTPGC